MVYFWSIAPLLLLSNVVSSAVIASPGRKTTPHNAAPVSRDASFSSKNNLAVYWGQGPSQQRLSHFCQQSAIDIIPIGFVNFFPAQGNGYAGTNFGNRCGSSTYQGPGYNGNNVAANNHLLNDCQTIVADIPICQATYGKKIILSLGGGLQTYQLTGAADGVAFADFLWGAYGPRTSAWVSQGKPRPFDGPNGEAVVVDGFDFDIEFPSTDNSAGYIAMINRLRSNFVGASKQFLITGAPQCVVPDANMGAMITSAQFDILFIQFYNTPYCSARSYVNNPATSSFSYKAWVSALAGTASANAKIYIGLPAAPAAAGSFSSTQSFYLSPAEATSLIKDFYCDAHFGGIMLWEATYADNNVVNGVTYQQAMKNLLLAVSSAASCLAAPTTTVPATLATHIAGTAHSPTSAVAPASQPTNISNDGSCGANGKSCPSGFCCSQYGYCGTDSGVGAYCGSGCQPRFGTCGAAPSPITPTTTSKAAPASPSTSTIAASPSTKTSAAVSSPKPSVLVSTNGTCGSKNGGNGLGMTCPSGLCCSQWGYCGADSGTGAWCGAGCQPAFGVCG